MAAKDSLQSIASPRLRKCRLDNRKEIVIKINLDMKEAEKEYEEYGMKEAENIIKSHNKSYKNKFAVNGPWALQQLIALKWIFVRFTLRGRIKRSFEKYKVKWKENNRGKTIFWLYRWEFIRLVFDAMVRAKDKFRDLTEIRYLWERCLVMDCQEPTVEGSVSVCDNIIAGRGAISDEQLLDDFVIKTNFKEFRDVDQELLGLCVRRWLSTHPSPICPRSKYKYSPTVDKIIGSGNDIQLDCNDDLEF